MKRKTFEAISAKCPKRYRKATPEISAEQPLTYCGNWPHFGAVMFLRTVVTPTPTVGNFEDPDISKMFTAAVNVFDNESAQFQGGSLYL